MSDPEQNSEEADKEEKARQMMILRNGMTAEEIELEFLRCLEIVEGA